MGSPSFHLYSNGKRVTDKIPLSEFSEEETGIFESLRTYGGKIFHLEEHLDRLFESAKTAGFSASSKKAGRGTKKFFFNPPIKKKSLFSPPPWTVNVCCWKWSLPCGPSSEKCRAKKKICSSGSPFFKKRFSSCSERASTRPGCTAAGSRLKLRP